MFLKRTIAYLEDWKKNALVGFILGAIVATIIIFLEPFDSEAYEASYKVLRLSGYGFCMFVPVVIFHLIENAIYRKQGRRWYIINEIVYTVIVFLIILICCAVYNFYIVNGLSGITWKSISGFLKLFGFPFLPIIFPIWLYLRFNWGTIKISEDPEEQSVRKEIVGDNKGEKIGFAYTEFVFAQSQQNYVILHLKTTEGLKQEMIRTTLANLSKQLPEAWQVHRSYLVNLFYLDSVAGNSRKRQMNLTVELPPIPISQKYYEALQKHLAISSQNVQ